MLYLLLEAGLDLYAVEASRVEAVVPCATLKQVPGAPAAVTGILNYRGSQVAVVDCGILLAGQPCALRYSTRILVCQVELAGRLRRLGLLGENITRVQRFPNADFVPPAARAHVPAGTGAVAVWEGRLVQRLHPEAVLGEEVLETLTAGDRP